MAALPERWTEKTPAMLAGTAGERPSRLDLEPAFGRASEVARLREEMAAAPVPPPKPRREWGPFMTCLQMPWSYGDRCPGDRWRRLRCRVGRHEISGGHPMQIDGAIVFIERRCRWCGVQPA